MPKDTDRERAAAQGFGSGRSASPTARKLKRFRDHSQDVAMKAVMSSPPKKRARTK